LSLASYKLVLNFFFSRNIDKFKRLLYWSQRSGAPICIRAEFMREGSPLCGTIFYSSPIEVGAKGPFAKIFCSSGRNKESTSTDLKLIPQPKLTYEGAEEMLALLNSLSLQKYAQLFLQQEVDLKAFIQLTDTDLTRMGITLMGPRVKIMQEINRLREEFQLPMLPPAISCAQSEDSSMWSLSSLECFLQAENANAVVNEQSASKKRKMLEPGSAIINEKNLSIYVFLSNIVAGKNALKKILFMVKSMKDKKQTEAIVQKIQQQVSAKLQQQSKRLLHEGKEAQLMLVLQPDQNGDWQARSSTDQIWSFRKGDYIKIDNHHNVDIGIRVHHFFIPDDPAGGCSHIEDLRSPTKYPILFPGGSLEIGLDENKDSRLALATEMDSQPSETFAVTHNGSLVMISEKNNMFEDTCLFSFKRRRTDTNMKKISSLDDFQKELFLSKCFDPTCLP